MTCIKSVQNNRDWKFSIQMFKTQFHMFWGSKFELKTGWCKCLEIPIQFNLDGVNFPFPPNPQVVPSGKHFQKAIENSPSIVDLTIKKMVIFHSKLLVYQVVNMSKDGNGLNSPRKTVAQGIQPHTVAAGFFATPAEKKRIEELQYHYISLYITYISLYITILDLDSDFISICM